MSLPLLARGSSRVVFPGRRWKSLHRQTFRRRKTTFGKSVDRPKCRRSWGGCRRRPPRPVVEDLAEVAAPFCSAATGAGDWSWPCWSRFEPTQRRRWWLTSSKTDLRGFSISLCCKNTNCLFFWWWLGKGKWAWKKFQSHFKSFFCATWISTHPIQRWRRS